ncbi:hypothetical protein [Pseudescherichia sp.]|uniref:hypothetical protein n=1 Tax=Pseudescherichia sp. TaxID=2055881 RepID=UPI0028A1C0CF|nr:hypothetical protein [Pseudescherichia sp.]
MLNKDNQYSLSDIVSYMKVIDLRNDNFCLYGEADEGLKANGYYYIADYPDVDDNDKEVYHSNSEKQKITLFIFR